MLNELTALFAQNVREAAAEVGNNAPRIADKIIETTFPKTCAEARYEGAEKMLRIGVIHEVKKMLRHGVDDGGQKDFSEITEQFREAASDLKSKTYFVESIDEYVSVANLIKTPEYLNEARIHMKKKGDECLDEAKRLDTLYHLVCEA